MQGNLLSLIGGNRRSVDTVADTSDAATNDELSSGTASNRDRSNLYDNANDHDHCAEEDGVAAAELVAEGEDERSSEEAASCIDSGNETFVCRIAIDLGESLDECGSGDDTAHNTLIITEEQEVGGCYNSDEQL